MATAAARRRQAPRARRLAIAGSLAAHLLMFGLLVLGWRSPPAREPDEPAISLDLVRPFAPSVPPPNPTKPAPKRAAKVATPSPPFIQSRPLTVVAGPAEPAVPIAPSGDARLSAALRGSLLGCVNARAADLTEAERETCRHTLAQGARTAPYISNVPPEKREYYAALKASQVAMDGDPLGGHLPSIQCGGDIKQRLGLKFGPCKLLAPLTPFTPEADVQPPK